MIKVNKQKSGVQSKFQRYMCVDHMWLCEMISGKYKCTMGYKVDIEEDLRIQKNKRQRNEGPQVQLMVLLGYRAKRSKRKKVT